MFNHITIMGRICNNLELKTTPNNIPVLTVNVAVERSYAAKGAEKATDFFPVVAWRHNAEFIAKYFSKGRMILVDGEMQSREYTDKDGIRRKVFEIIADKVRFTGEKKETEHGGGYAPAAYETPAAPAPDSGYSTAQNTPANGYNPTYSQPANAEYSAG